MSRFQAFAEVPLSAAWEPTGNEARRVPKASPADLTQRIPFPGVPGKECEAILTPPALKSIQSSVYSWQHNEK